MAEKPEPRQYAVLTEPLGHQEFESQTCNHCNAAVVAESQQRFRNAEGLGDLGRVCAVCGKWICDRCLTIGGCDPWKQQMKRMEGEA